MQQADLRVKFIKKNFKYNEYNLYSNNSILYLGNAPEDQLNTSSYVWDESEFDEKIFELRTDSFPRFSEAKFISHKKRMDLEEAKNGGVYYFKYVFRLELNPEIDIKECKITMLTKGQLFGWTNRSSNEAPDFIFGEPDLPHTYYHFLRNLQMGYNEIIFKIVNKENHNIEDWKENTYGFMFNLRFVLTD